MKYLISIIISIFLLSSISLAQTKEGENEPDNGEDSGYRGSVIIEGFYTPRISDAFKIKNNPEIKPVELEKEPVSYDIQPVRLPVSFDLEPIRPAKMKGQPLDKLYNNHMRLAMGSSTMPYFEYYYHSTRSRDNAFGMHLKHHSAAGKIDNHPFPGFSDNQADIRYKKIFRKHILETTAGYTRNVFHGYGIPKPIYDTLNDVSKKDIRLLFHRLDATVSFKSDYSVFRDSKVHHSMNLDLYHFFNDANNSETNIDFDGDLYTRLHFLQAAEDQTFGLKIGTDYLFNRYANKDGANRGVFHLTPYLKNEFNNIDLDLGINVFVDSDSVSSRIRFYPDIHGRMELIKDIFSLKAGITGNTSHDQLSTMTQENPFVRLSTPTRFQYTQSKIYGGLSASISKDINFNAYFTAAHTENATFFRRDTLAWGNRYIAEHDTIRSISIKAEVDYQLKEKLNIALGGQYSEYTTTSLKAAWNKPGVEAYLKARYDLQETIILQTEVFFVGQREGLKLIDNSYEIVTLDPFLDANFSAEYRYNKKLSGFLQFRNIASQQYEKWAGYPVYGFQFMAGLTYSM